MAILDLAIRRWGFEDPRAIIIATLEEQGHTALAAKLWEILTTEE